MKPIKLTKGRFAGRTVECAEQTRVERFWPEVERVLVAVGHPEAFVTDLSQLGDFSLDDADLAAIGDRLRLTVTRQSYIADLAEILRGVS